MLTGKMTGPMPTSAVTKIFEDDFIPTFISVAMTSN